MLTRKYHNPEDPFINCIMFNVDNTLFELDGIPAYKEEFAEVSYEQVEWEHLTGTYLCVATQLMPDDYTILMVWWDGYHMYHMSYNPFRAFDWLMFKCKRVEDEDKRRDMMMSCFEKRGVVFGKHFDVVEIPE